MKPTKFQIKVKKILSEGKSVLVVAPTGLGKTYAALADLQKRFIKVVYATPLRALGFDIRDAIRRDIKRNENELSPVVHHGDTMESSLFSEEIVVTTYDQVVCAAPGLPLSFPLKSGHAVAGALLMSRLIFDEAHLAWAISKQALSILFGILEFRKNLGLQTVLMTATLPQSIAEAIAERFFDKNLVFVGQEDLKDEGLQSRDRNRKVIMNVLTLKPLKDEGNALSGEDDEEENEEEDDGDQRKGRARGVHTKPLDDILINTAGKRIYFANTVERLQETYDRLITRMDPVQITVLHNRMPRNWRLEAEKQTQERFGKGSHDGDFLLLTNQVAEAGLDISAPLVISDPAPVDTLIQRSGRCARWFRNGNVEGVFYVLKPKGKRTLADWSYPYNVKFKKETAVELALKNLPENSSLSWAVEQQWLREAWNGGEEVALAQIQGTFNETTFALNLFDRAAQEQKPGEIASVFREILSVNVAIEEGSSIVSNFVGDDNNLQQELQKRLDDGLFPETSSISLRRAWSLIKQAKGNAGVIRYIDDQIQIVAADYVKPDDILILPSSIAYLHKAKGLCFAQDGGLNEKDKGLIENKSKWARLSKEKVNDAENSASYQSLFEHTKKVMSGVQKRLSEAGSYQATMINILKALEPEKDVKELADIIAEVARVAAGLHDLGKADKRWQQKARMIDPEAPLNELIGRTHKETRAGKIGRPHTPPAYLSTLEACRLLLGGSFGDAEYLVRVIALAAARHHSSLLNPAKVKYQFEPDEKATEFVKLILKEVKAPEQILLQADAIVKAAQAKPSEAEVPLLFPNDDLFPIYALIGRAVLIADREDASGMEIEKWRCEKNE